MTAAPDNIVDLVARQRSQRIVAAFDVAFAALDTWPARRLFAFIRRAVPGATNDQIASTLRAAKRFDLPASLVWWGNAMTKQRRSDA